ncbi:MAG: DUF4148 domain-containing protein [Hydrogenophaga sp.]|uniref:DUF4148 domain-containing protein n=1 Tax=Hydrogenophaga sp. TaxID=1904254 RepID=UPI001DDF3BF8|nr:DUF4148 domain-containing protein [Hydrogenophaga sp.]MBX3609599.1 DUF4148 domain-containing protein [Hydrogenophaga sp.]
MKTARFVLPLAIALSAGAAFAQGPIEGNEVFNFQSTLSRAEVQAQAAQAYRDGAVARGEIGELPDTAVASNLSREQVRAEAAVALHQGLTARGELATTGV